MTTAMAGEKTPGLRLDKWLWHARFAKSRTLAAKICQSGRVRLNAERISKPHQMIRIGDVLTFPLGLRIRVVKIIDLGVRRGPAPEAQALYEDLTPSPAAGQTTSTSVSKDAAREPGAGRPTKADRRAIDDLMGQDR
jgi:ribosome-associated heat shock protein Hsp15